ncbi:MAG: AAA family ATPase, partial [Pseudomonadales bacterium]
QLHLALVLAIDVDLLVLDEPTLGLDILRRKAFYERVLNDCFDKNTSVIISTHQVEEVEELLTHLLFIDKGKIVLDCAMDAIDQQYCELLLDGPEHLAAAQALAPLHSRQVQGQQAMIFERAKQDELAKLSSLGSLRRPSVADLFVAKMQQD